MPANLADPTHQKIDSLIKGSRTFLFMKGNRNFPQCGFSAAVVGILDELGITYDTFNILEDPAIRDGAKAFADWPTFPQLYVDGEFVGGADIVRGMYHDGALHALFQLDFVPVAEPKITLSPAAVAFLREAAVDEPHAELRVECNAKFDYGLALTERRAGDFVLESNGFTVLVDRGSARYVDGLLLDFSQDSGGFLIDNPNEPPRVRNPSVRDLERALAQEPELHLYDVRTPEERERAAIPGSVLLTPEVHGAIMQLPRDTPLWFVCHSGARSGAMADTFLHAGFTKVHNVHGGISAWAREIDPSMGPL